MSKEIKPGMRVQIVSGFYEGHAGEVVNKVNDQWRVKLDQAGKLALVDEKDIGKVETTE